MTSGKEGTNMNALEKMIRLGAKAARLLSQALVFFSLVTAIGCSFHKPSLIIQSTPRESVKAPLGKIAIVAAQSDPELHVRVPAKGPLQGIRDGATYGFQIGNDFSQDFLTKAIHTDLCRRAKRGCGEAQLVVLIEALAFRVAFPPLGGATGGLVGGLVAENKKVVERSDRAVQQALDRLKIQTHMRDSVLRVVAQESPYEASPVDRVGPLPSGHYDTFLQIRISDISLIGNERSVNPPLQILVGAKTVLMRGTDGTLIDERRFEQASEPRQFAEWGDHDAELFAKELEGLYLSLAEHIVDELLGYPQTTIQTADEILARNPEHVGARIGRGIAYVKLGEYESALEDLQRVRVKLHSCHLFHTVAGWLGG